MIPIIPNSLREFLEAPVPLIGGISDIGNQERQNLKTIIWVLLDEPNVNRKIQGSTHLVQEVIELEAPQLKRNLFELYKIFEGDNYKFVGNSDETLNCFGIVNELKGFYMKIIDSFKGIAINQHNLNSILVKKFQIYDHDFIKAMTQTLMFHNKLGGKST